MSNETAGGDKRVKSKDGNTYIPATQRPDGTWRKPVKVKAGYVPHDEQPRYQCKAQLATQRQGESNYSKFPIGWSPKELQKQANGIKEQRKQAQQESSSATNEGKNVPITQQDHIQKKIHGLQKKVDDIEKLKTRIDNGELKSPEKTQLEKLERKPQLIKEIDELTEELNRLNTGPS